MVVVTGCHSPGLGDNRYRVSGRRAPVTAREVRAAAGTSALGVAVGPYGGIVAVYHPPGQSDSRYLGGGRFVNRPYGVIVAASVFSSGRFMQRPIAGWRGCGRAGAARGAALLPLYRPWFLFWRTNLVILCVLHSYYVKNSAIFQFPFLSPPYYNGHR